LIIKLEAFGFLVKLAKLKANNPALFGIIFKAKSESADKTLLFAGLFKVGDPNISPAILNYFFYFIIANAIKDPAPCPKKKRGVSGYSLVI
jgi:hypothetical protein